MYIVNSVSKVYIITTNNKEFLKEKDYNTEQTWSAHSGISTRPCQDIQTVVMFSWSRSYKSGSVIIYGQNPIGSNISWQLWPYTAISNLSWQLSPYTTLKCHKIQDCFTIQPDNFISVVFYVNGYLPKKRVKIFVRNAFSRTGVYKIGSWVTTGGPVKVGFQPGCQQ
jgi:hypothetical protein